MWAARCLNRDITAATRTTLGGWLSRDITLLLHAQLVHGLDYHEQSKGNYGEADDRVYKQPQVEGNSPGSLSISQRMVGCGGLRPLFEHDEKI